MNEIYLLIATVIGGVVTKSFDWIFIRKKSNQDLKAQQIDNEVKLAEYYKKMLDDLNERYDRKYRETVEAWDIKERMMKDEIVLLQKRVKMLEAENKEFKKKGL